VALAPMSSRAETVATVTAAAGTVPGRYTVTVVGTNHGLDRADPIAVDVSAAPPAPPPTTTAAATAALTIRKAGRGRGTVSGGPIDCGRRCTATVAVGTAETLAEKPARGSRFTRWSGACSGTRPRCVVVVARATTVTAAFAPQR
jgi:hypothetical protein